MKKQTNKKTTMVFSLKKSYLLKGGICIASPRSSGFLKLYAKDILCNEMFVLKKTTYKSIYYYSIIIKMY